MTVRTPTVRCIFVTLALVGSCSALAAGQQPDATIAAATGCDVAAFTSARDKFERLQARRSFSPDASTDAALRAASIDYLLLAETCYAALYSDATAAIDDGGLRFGPEGMEAAPFLTFGTKWGAGSPFARGQDLPGPGVPGGTITYSFMGTGVSMLAEGDYNSVAISSLPAVQACFMSRITSSFAAWTAVANIQFVQSTDNGMPFNGSGATGDIRIGAHSLDGPGKTLAHGYYPPPNGASAAGDIHFDMHEPWSCAPGSGVFDIGIVALHEIGHAIGLGHEPYKTAVMNPFYTSSAASLWPDDITGGRSIYGETPVGVPTSSDDLVVSFGPSYGLWMLADSSAWSPLNGGSPENLATGDFDATGIDDVVADFGSAGLWIRWNNTSWIQLHAATADRMVTGDLDGNGRDELIVDFPGAGVWVWTNNSHWVQLHPSNSSGIATGDMDGNGRKEVIIDFPKSGIWVWANNLSWFRLHAANSSHLRVGDFDGNGRADVAVNFDGFGIWNYSNNSTWAQIHSTNAVRMESGDVDGNGKSDLIIDFVGGAGIWALRNATTWSRVHTTPSMDIVMGDLNGNGKSDVVVDFGDAGLWTYADDIIWIRLHAVSPERMAVGDINAR